MKYEKINLHPDFRKYRFIRFIVPNFLKSLVNILFVFLYRNTLLSPKIEKKCFTVTGYNNQNIKLEMYQLKEECTKETPCIIAFHGGGFWCAAAPFHKKLYSKYILGTKAKLIYVDYTLSIKNPYPYGVEDCYLASLWIYEHGNELKIDKKRIAILGDSAGGALTAAVTQMLRDRNKFKPCFQMLLYPLTDDRFETNSSNNFSKAPIWNTPASKDAKKLYLKGFYGKTTSYAYPIHAKDFCNLPPCYIEVAEYDSLKDEGINYSNCLNNNGINVEFVLIKGVMHAFDMNLKSEITKNAIKNRIKAFNRIFCIT